MDEMKNIAVNANVNPDPNPALVDPNHFDPQSMDGRMIPCPDEAAPAREASLARKTSYMGRLLHRYYMLAARAHGAVGDPLRGQGRVLALLKAKPETSQRELSFLLDMRQQSLSELLAKLEDKGYVVRGKSQADARVTTVRLTEAGAAAAPDPDAMAERADALDCLSPEDRAQFEKYVDVINASLEQKLVALGDDPAEHRGHRGHRPDDIRNDRGNRWDDNRDGFSGFGGRGDRGADGHCGPRGPHGPRGPRRPEGPFGDGGPRDGGCCGGGFGGRGPEGHCGPHGPEPHGPFECRGHHGHHGPAGCHGHHGHHGPRMHRGGFDRPGCFGPYWHHTPCGPNRPHGWHHVPCGPGEAFMAWGADHGRCGQPGCHGRHGHGEFPGWEGRHGWEGHPGWKDCHGRHGHGEFPGWEGRHGWEGHPGWKGHHNHHRCCQPWKSANFA